jgi:CubicO group peptidase (beta-lactamase class C family)
VNFRTQRSGTWTSLGSGDPPVVTPAHEGMNLVSLNRRNFLETLIAMTGASLSGSESVAETSSGTTRGVTMAPLSDLKLTAMHAGALLERHIASGYITGAVALIAHGEHAEVIETGVLGNEDASGVRRDSIFRISSMTKPITAAATMMLIERGALHLGDPVSKWLPELAHRRVLRRIDAALEDTVPERRPLTVEDLLTFRCGWGVVLPPAGVYPIQREITRLDLLGFGPPDPANPLKPAEWLRRLGTLPLMAQPGEEWLYNTGSYILGALLARVTSRSLPDVLRALIFEPLGMKDTGFFVPDSSRKRLVSAYRMEAGRATLFDAPASSAWAKPPAFPDGGAGLVSTVDDYFAFARLLLSGGRAGRLRLLSEAAIAAMTTNHLTSSQRETGSVILGAGRGWGYGLAVVDGPTEASLPQGSIGWNGGLGTSWQSDPATGATALLLTQTMFTSPAAPAVHQEFQRAVFTPAFV